MSNEVNNQLLDLLKEGLATEEQQGVALKALQIGMAYTLTTGVQSILKNVDSLSETVARVIEKINEKLSIEIDADSATRQQLMQFVDTVQQRQIQVMDLYRKIVQGKSFFETEVLSEEERMVVKLFKSFSTAEEKRKFLMLCEEQLSKKENE